MRSLAFLLLLMPLFCAATEVRNLRLWHAPDQTRLVFDVSGPVEHDVFTMTGPDRLVIDLIGARARGDLTLPPQVASRIKRLRYSRRGHNDLRIVFDLNAPFVVHEALLPPRAPYGHRLVIDLVGQLPVAAAATPPVASQPPGDRGGREWIVAIDAGHGGEDVGAIGPRGTYEKDVVLAVARELATLIDREPNLRAVLVRDGDYYVDLRDRMVRARKAKADLFVSVHADAFRDRRVRGSSVYVLSNGGASSEAARWLAEQENSADLVGGVTLDDKDQLLRSVLLDLSQTASLEASLDVATEVLGALRRVGEVHRTRVQAAGFMVLKSPDIPSLLVETAFISNPQEEQRLRNAAFRRKLAGALRDGIKGYFENGGGIGRRLVQGRQHRVDTGETLAVIASQYDVSTADIRMANDLDGDILRTGELLRIP